MKTFILSVCLFLISFTYAQNRIFTHTATSETIQNGYTYLNHPMLNDNANAKIILTHNWNPGGVGGVLNNKRSGVYYNGSLGKWAIYNEDLSAVIPNSSYNVYINFDDDVIVVASSTVDPPSSILEFDHPLVIGNPDAMLGVQTYWNPNETTNNHTYGVEYDGDSWFIYNEGLTGIPPGAAFFVLINGLGVQNARHLSNDTNENENGTMIDHPLLNNNPNAVFIISHVYGVDGANQDINAQLGVYYNLNVEKWVIFREDLILIPTNAAFNLFIHDSSMATDEMTASEFKIYPNPVKDILNISNEKTIEKAEIFDLTGKTFIQKAINSNQTEIDMSRLPAGIYLVKIQSEGKTQTQKVIKK